jgi:hypothetical protein
VRSFLSSVCMRRLLLPLVPVLVLLLVLHAARTDRWRLWIMRIPRCSHPKTVQPTPPRLPNLGPPDAPTATFAPSVHDPRPARHSPSRPPQF